MLSRFKFSRTSRKSVLITQFMILCSNNLLASALQSPIYMRRYNQRMTHRMFQTAIAVESIVDQECWNDYEELMKDIMTQDRVIKKHEVEMMEPVQEYLLSNAQMLTLPLLNSTSFREDLRLQQQLFQNVTGFTKQEYEYCIRCLTYLGDWCAKKKLHKPAQVGWYKIRECGTRLRENAISTYLYVLGEEQGLDAEIATFHDLLFEPNEKTITLRIKSLINRGDALKAEQTLFQLPDKGSTAQWKRLRTFIPILSHYCEKSDMSSALRLFRQMRNSDGVFFDADTYATLICALARNGHFESGAAPIVGLNDFGFNASSGPRLFDAICGEMAEDLLEINEETAKKIYEAFDIGAADKLHGEIPAITHVGKNFMIGRISIDDKTGVCPATGAKLRLFALTPTERRNVHDTLLQMARIQHEEYSKNIKGKNRDNTEMNGSYAFEQLRDFSRWLCDRNGLPYTAIVDGPNVAYYGSGQVRYSQVALVVNALEEMGERPLVTMPEKYINPKFWLRGLGVNQELSEKDISIIEDLKNSARLYTVPGRCLDDYYWMLASVADQTHSRLYVASDHQSRFPGLRPILVTNDQMRDHKLALLEPRQFRRWTSCHIVNYDIRPFQENEWETREVQFFPADFFSREIQGNAMEGGITWHFPVTEWEDPFRFYVSLRGS